MRFASVAFMNPPASPPASVRPSRLRPVDLPITKIRLPVTATVSLAHRISGVLKVPCLPLLAYGLSDSLAGPERFAAWVSALQSWPGRAFLLVLTWALAHHTAAGIRHLLFDTGIGTRYSQARATAWVVHAVAAAAVVAVLLSMAMSHAGAGA